MAYYIDLFSPETYEAFTRSTQEVSGFRQRHHRVAEKIKPGDIFVCYLIGLARWFGLLEVIDGPYIDKTPLFELKDDPFIIRFKVRTIIWLDIDKALPIHADQIWNALSFTRTLEKGSKKWVGKVRSSLVSLGDKDGKFLADNLTAQSRQLLPYPLNDLDKRKLNPHTVNLPGKVITVSIPDDSDPDGEPPLEIESETRESIQIQAKLAQIGSCMGMSIWIPRSDRGNVLREWTTANQLLLDRLPLNYDDTTLSTIEQIDVIWLRNRSIIRAFEVEHTTSIYSGILRMADLLALQPNMDIKLHIVAPSAKREKVFQQIRRPVFALLARGPLAESCTYLSYQSIKELSAQRHLAHLSDTVLDEYAEEAE
jgi:hypothetical protein